MKTNAKNPVGAMRRASRNYHNLAANSQVKKLAPPFHRQVSEAVKRGRAVIHGNKLPSPLVQRVNESTRRGRALMQAGKRGERLFPPARSVV